jgi:RNA-splicing ligase RtcB
MKTIEGHDVKIFTDNIEEKALAQLHELLSIDVFADKKIRIMPDVHCGAGCVIGFTGDLGDKVIPNIVGVDIGCGMRVLKLGELEDVDFHAFHKHILANVPSGNAVRRTHSGYMPLAGAELEIYNEARELIEKLRCYEALDRKPRLLEAIGSLGGGNHFIELDKDEKGNVYLVIHTGSRNLGTQVADLYQKKAIKHLTDGAENLEERIKDKIAELSAAGRSAEIQAEIERMRKEAEAAAPRLPAPLCYVEGAAREDYLHDMRICQRWASLNRRLIAVLLLKFFGNPEVQEEFESVHNYISDENVIRKGAISAAKGERCIIPLNMRDGSLLCTGKGNPDWNESAPHGAGRVLSRTKAYNTLKIQDFKESMQGIYSECVRDSTLDESPMAYKPAEEIIANIGGTVTIDSVIRPIFNFKAA